MTNASISAMTIARLLTCGMAAGLSAQSHQASGDGPQIWLHGQARMVVKDAVNGALRRLGMATCQLVLQDFLDASARPLKARLEALGQTAPGYLASMYFVDGDDAPQCRLHYERAAFTEPGSRVIHVCAWKFAKQFARRPAGGEILVIHELLHSLGLGENPPTSATITERVRLRCGD